MLEPPQIEILQIAEVTRLELVLVSQSPGLTSAAALDNNYVYVDWGLVHAFEHARAFPDAVPAGTRVSQARMALEYILSLGGAAYLPKSMIAGELKAGTLHPVAKAPVFNRNVFAVYPVRTAQLDLIEKCIALL
jgi:DNA-binding transcriptional LysR family regulator